MKKVVILFLFAFSLNQIYSQTKEEIASVYMKRAQSAIEEEANYKKATLFFEKGINVLDRVSEIYIAKLGVNIYYTQQKYKLAQKYSQIYFTLVKDKTTEEYTSQLDLAVTLNELVSKQVEEEKKLEALKRKKLRKKKRLDSLNNLWENKSKQFAIAADSIYKFDINGYAIFRKDDKYGLLTDKGEIIIPASGYKDAIANDGFILFTNLKKEAFVLYCYNTNTKEGYLLPRPYAINGLSTHYGKIMLPRGNGILVTYPDKTAKPFVYNLNTRQILRLDNKEDFLKQLKKDDIIEKYNDEEDSVRLEKVWYQFGGTLGGKLFSVFLDNNSHKIHSFVSGITGRVLLTGSDYEYIGGFYKRRYEALFDNKRGWIDEKGLRTNAPYNEAGVYSGKIQQVKTGDGFYHFMKDGQIVLGNKTLISKKAFLKKFEN